MSKPLLCLSLLAAVMLVLCGDAQAQRSRDEEKAREAESRIRLRGRPTLLESPPVHVEHYTSKMDGESRPYGVCVVGESNEPLPLLVLVSPGLSTEPDEMALLRSIQESGQILEQHGKACILIRPTGRGPGSLYENYGEVDVLEAIDDVCQKHSIDRDRISVYGHSMGGAATWYLTSHYPDLFASASPSSGYCDYRLWTKAGGYTYHMFPWEEPSWQSRSAVFLVENFEHTPVWILHGERDRALGGGVPVQHSRTMYRLLSEAGCPVKYTEVPDTGHHLSGPTNDNNLQEQYLLWMLEQKKTRNPTHVALATFDLRHNTSYWVTIDQLEAYGKRGVVDARLSDDGTVLTVTTENVRAFTLGPVEGAKDVRVRLDGEGMGRIDLTSPEAFQHGAGWTSGSPDLSHQKRHGQSGPISDLFFDKCIFVNGTKGTEDENYYVRGIAGYMRNAFNKENGGLHRGGIMGENTVELKLAADTELSEDEIKGNNLVLFGTDRTNALVKRFAPKLKLAFEDGAIRLGEKTFQGDDVAILAVFPHPENPDRYIAIHGGVTPDAIVAGSHLHLLLLPDYVVYNGGDVLETGFFDNDWK